MTWIGGRMYVFRNWLNIKRTKNGQKEGNILPPTASVLSD